MSSICLTEQTLDALMPMHMVVDMTGAILQAGRSVFKLFESPLIGRSLFDVIEIKVPETILGLEGLRAHAGRKLQLSPRENASAQFKAQAVEIQMGEKRCFLLNLSAGIGLPSIVSRYHLSGGDFAPTDMALEMLYLIEAQSAVMAELRRLNTRLNSEKEEARSQADRDCLTGLHNRRPLSREMQRMIVRGLHFAILLLDMNAFKSINDTLGHLAGDQALCRVANILQSETRQSDLVARIGGDEFVILFKNLIDLQIVKDVAARINQNLSIPYHHEERAMNLSLSSGIALSIEDASPTVEGVLSAADLALYASKAAGGKTHVATALDGAFFAHPLSA